VISPEMVKAQCFQLSKGKAQGRIKLQEASPVGKSQSKACKGGQRPGGKNLTGAEAGVEAPGVA
jgi:hypothetical protein